MTVPTAKILIIDDAPTDIAILASIVSDMAKVIFATSGEEGLRRLTQETFDIVLLDLILPDVDGFEVMRRMNDTMGAERPAVIFVTAVSSTESEERGLDLGAVDYVSKPFVPAVVRARVRNHLLLSRTTQALRRANAQLTQLASIDPLTNVLNRRQFFLDAQDEFDRADRHDQTIGVVMLDLDHFKEINDECGHEQGDLVLSEVARAWQGELRAEDKLGRIGGEEFALVLPGAGIDRVRTVAERMLVTARGLALPTRGGGTMHLTASAGCTVRIPFGDSLRDALHYADRALLGAKRAGRDRVEMEPTRMFEFRV